MLGVVGRLPRLALTAAFAGPMLVARGAGPVVEELADRSFRLGADVAVATARSAVRVARVARNAAAARPAPWVSGRRLHVPLSPAGDARRLAATVARGAGVVDARWDGGLRSLLVTMAEDAVVDDVVAWVTERAAEHDMAPTERPPDPDQPVLSHPGDTTEVRTAATAVALDCAGLAVAVGARAVRAPRVRDWLQAAATAAREHPAARALLNERIGWHQAELARVAVSAAARGLSQAPGQLVLDTMVHTGQLVDAVARAAAFDAAHDSLCRADRPSMGVVPDTRQRTVPVEDYAAGAVDSGLLGALAALVLRRDPDEAANAILAASPLPARCAHAAFHAAVGTVLAREGVLVRDADRIRSLDTVDTLVLHDRVLRHDGGLDPHAEAVLDAARRAGLRVVVAGRDAELGELTALVDDVADAVTTEVERLREEGHVVLAVARPAPASGPHADEVTGLLAADVAVAVIDDDAPVVWGADVIVHNGLEGVWRVLRATAAAGIHSRRATALGKASATLGGLIMLAGTGGRGHLLPRTVNPMLVAGLSGLVLGWGTGAWVAAATPPAPRERVAWHELTAEETIDRLRSAVPDSTPLTEAVQRIRSNAVAFARQPALAPARHGAHLLADVVAELNDPLTPVLALGAVASAVVGSPVDAGLVAAAMGLNAVVGGTQRFRGRLALAALRAGERQRAHRVTGDRVTVVDASALRPGDVLALEVGDVVPADARLLELEDLELDESALTGESLPVSKQVEPTPGAAVAERHCLVFAGTTVVSGTARAVVVGVGEDTTSGRAVSLAARTPPSAGIQARLRELTRKAMPLTLGGGALVTALSAMRGTPMRTAVAGGVAVAVAAVPEGLPLVATVAQLAAARRLSARGVLVRAPRALEALGRLDTVCFDKTGTLTENRLRVAAVTDENGQRIDVTGDALALLAAARACPSVNGDRQPHATDRAILDAASVGSDWEQRAGQPFEASRGYSATVGRTGGETWLLVKGAPEIVLPVCESDHAAEGEALADSGLRVIAVAGRLIGADETPPTLGNGDDDVLTGLRFLGFVGLSDTPRDGAAEVVAALRDAGVAPVMLTGDHPHTARAIAHDLGWPADAPVITGADLVSANQTRRAELLADAAVIARVAPEQKLQVIEALRAAGRVTAMVGDGTNDAAAIRAAHVGIGVRAASSTAARTAADIALGEADLTALLDAVAEGRALWRSVSDAVTILLGGNAGEVGFSVLGSLVGGTPPLNTRQFLLVNLMTDLFPAMAVAVTRPDDDISPTALGDALTRNIRNRGITTGIGATTAWLTGRLTPGTQRRTSTMALCGLVGAQLVQTLRGRWHSPLVVGTAAGSALALAVVVQTPGVSQFFGCTPLGPVAWTGVIGGIGAAATASLLPPLRASN